MKIAFSLPKDEGFFNAYAALIPSLRRLGFLAQVIGGLTEAAVLYALLLDKFRETFPPAYTLPAALVGAVLGAVFLEIGLRHFTPHAFRAVLYRRFAGLHSIMTTFILLTAAGLLLSSGYLHLYGSKDLVRVATPPPALASAAPVDSLHQVETAAIEARYQAQAEALKAKFAALVNVERQALQRLEAREKRTGKNYPTSRERLAAKIAALEADAAGQLAALQEAQAGELAQADARRMEGRAKVEAGNEQTKAGHAAKVQRYGRGLAGVTIVLLLVFVLVIGLEEVYHRGAGIEELPQPTQYTFSQSITGEALAAWCERWNYLVRSRIARFAGKTPPPPMPAEPHPLRDAPRRRLAQPAEEGPQEGQGSHQNGQQAQAEQVENPYNDALERLFSSNGNGIHNAAGLVEVRTQPDVDPDFERAAYILGNENYHDAAALLERAAEVYHAGQARPVIQGFQRRGDGDAPITTAVITTAVKDRVITVKDDSHLTPCLHCGTKFLKRQWNQKFCREDCRLAYHETKHGQPFQPKEYHKARRRKTGKKRN